MIGAFFALPNLYGEDPALQISGAHGLEVDDAALDKVKNALEAKNISGEYELETVSCWYASRIPKSSCWGVIRSIRHSMTITSPL